MSNVLRGKHEGIGKAYKIMKSLDGLFGEQPFRAKYGAMKVILNGKQKPKTPIREHDLRLIDLLNEVEANE